jgi:hypothetical protein
MMHYIYAGILLCKTKKAINEASLQAVLDAANAPYTAMDIANVITMFAKIDLKALLAKYEQMLSGLRTSIMTKSTPPIESVPTPEPSGLEDLFKFKDPEPAGLADLFK